MGKYSIFITTGTLELEFTRVFNLVRLLSQSGEFNEIIVQGKGASHFFKKDKKISAYEIIDKDLMNSFYAKVDFVISHCGVGSIVNSLVYAKPTVFIPRLSVFKEHFDDHQLQIFSKISSNSLFCCTGSDATTDLDVSKLIVFFSDKAVTKKDFSEMNLINKQLSSFIMSEL